RLCQQHPTGVLFRGCIVRFILRSACLSSPTDWLRQDEVRCSSTRLLRYIVTPAFDAVRYRTTLGVRLNGRTGNLPLLGLSPNQYQQLVRLHAKARTPNRKRRGNNESDMECGDLSDLSPHSKRSWFVCS